MSTTKPNIIRKIAEQQLDSTFPGLSSPVKNELATSLVRQWITYDGAAVIIDWQHQFWFRLTRLESGTTQVVRDVQKSHFTEQMRRSRVAEGETRGLLHELSVRQLARCLTDYGKMLQLRVDPAKSLFCIELVPEADR